MHTERILTRGAVTGAFAFPAVVGVLALPIVGALALLVSAAPASAEGAAQWDDSHMQSRFPSQVERSQTPRLILPEGAESNSLPAAKSIYTTPDRNWKSGNGSRAGVGTSSGSGGFSLGTPSIGGVSVRNPSSTGQAPSGLRSTGPRGRNRR